MSYNNEPAYDGSNPMGGRMGRCSEQHSVTGKRVNALSGELIKALDRGEDIVTEENIMKMMSASELDHLHGDDRWHGPFDR